MSARPLPNILARIRATKVEEIARLLEASSYAVLEQRAAARLARDVPRDFLAAVTADAPVPQVIAEVKKASPSKGVIRPDFDPAEIARAYRQGGAAALSCLTDVSYFQGDLSYLPQVRDAGGVPTLRKDFLLDEAQIFESCAEGADAVLLIARMLPPERLAALYRLARALGMAVLLEVHDEADLEVCGGFRPMLLGVNNRDLDTFVVDMETTFRLRGQIPDMIPVVAESGIGTAAQLRELRGAGICAVLVGESLMRQPDVTAALLALRGVEGD